MNLGARGEQGERLAERYLKGKGYRIVARNFQTRFGEVDIICENGQYLLFVEVKARGFGALASGRHSVNVAKQRRIIKTAMLYLQQRPSALQPRFDVIEVDAEGGICHIENAFDAGSVYEYF